MKFLKKFFKKSDKPKIINYRGYNVEMFFSSHNNYVWYIVDKSSRFSKYKTHIDFIINKFDGFLIRGNKNSHIIISMDEYDTELGY